MAITIPIVTEFADKGITAAQASFANFKNKVSEADGAMGKLKAGAGAAFDGIKANAASLAAGAGAAIAGFALKAIGDFQELALEVDKFSNSTGLAAEQASRWTEVAGDLGVETGTLTGAFNKMNRAVADNSSAFAELGAEIVKTDSGATDVNATFLNTIEALKRVKDPAERARLATATLGKSWTELSELVEMGAGDLRKALDDVAGAKVIDEAEIQKAKDLRAAQDALKDVLEEFAITVGVTLAPVLTEFAEQLAGIGQHASTVGRIFKVVAGAVTRDMEMMAEGITGVDRDNVKLSDSLQETVRTVRQFSEANQTAAGSLEAVDEALTELKGNVDQRQAWRNLQTEIEKVKDAAIQAFVEATPDAIRESEDALDRMRIKVGEYVNDIDDIPTDIRTSIIANLDRASVQEIENILNYLARMREVSFMPRVPPGVGGPNEIGSGGRPIGVAPLPVPRPIAGKMSAGVVVNVAGSVIAERDLVETVRKGLVDAQRSGSGLVYPNF